MLRFTSALLGFGVELAVLFALGAWGLHLPFTLFVRLGAAVVAVLGVAFLWGRFLSPRASQRLPTPSRALGKVVVFVVGAAAAWAGGLTAFAGVIAGVAAVSLVLEFVVGVPPAVAPHA